MATLNKANESLKGCGKQMSIEQNSDNYLTSVYFMDLINELEKMGDFIINISQDLLKYKLKVTKL